MEKDKKMVEVVEAEIMKRSKSPGEVNISTIFLGLDFNLGVGPPVLFETMILGGKLDRKMWRYSTWEEGEKGHKNAVNKISMEGR